MKALWQGISHLIAPRVCNVCKQTLTQQEDTICLECMLDMPRANIHTQDFNILHQRLGHECHVDRAAGWFYYRKDTPYAQMLVAAKYSNLPGLCWKLGEMCAQEFQADGFFVGIDVIVPMTMHWLKRMRRGYNQAEEISRGISSVTGVPVANAIKAIRGHGVQSRHNKAQRYSMIADTMEVRKADSLQGKHVLIVDDIITTGASMAEAVRAVQAASPKAVSVMCLGLTQLS